VLTRLKRLIRPLIPGVRYLDRRFEETLGTIARLEKRVTWQEEIIQSLRLAEQELAASNAQATEAAREIRGQIESFRTRIETFASELEALGAQLSGRCQPPQESTIGEPDGAAIHFSDVRNYQISALYRELVGGAAPDDEAAGDAGSKQGGGYRHRFIVASHGQTATFWFARALDSHPDIHCTHGYTYPSVSARARILTNEETARQRKITYERYFRMNLDEYFAEQEEQRAARSADDPDAKGVLGSVHTLTAGMIFHHLKVGVTTPFTWANMIRHPIARLHSVTRHWERLADDVLLQDQLEKDWEHARFLLEYCEGTLAEATATHSDKLFTIGIKQMSDIAQDIIQCINEDVLLIHTERLTRNREYFRDTVARLCGAHIDVGDDYLDEVFAQGRSNIHAEGRTRDPATIYRSWPLWRQAMLRNFFAARKYTELYSMLGYDTACLRQ
jgi:hypothetical protein